MNLVDELHCVQMIDTGVETNLIHDHDSGLLDLIFKFTDAVANVARGYNVRLALDGGLDNGDMVDVRNKRNDKIVLCNSLLQGGAVGHVKGNSSCVGQVASQALSGRKRAARCAHSARVHM